MSEALALLVILCLGLLTFALVSMMLVFTAKLLIIWADWLDDHM